MLVVVFRCRARLETGDVREMPQGKGNSVVVGIGTTQVKWKTPPKAAYRAVPF